MQGPCNRTFVPFPLTSAMPQRPGTMVRHHDHHDRLFTLCPRAAHVRNATICLRVSLDYLAVPPRAPLEFLCLGQLHALCSHRSRPFMVCFPSFFYHALYTSCCGVL